MVFRGRHRRQRDPLIQHAREMLTILGNLVASVPDGDPAKAQGREVFDRMSAEYQVLERDINSAFLN